MIADFDEFLTKECEKDNMPSYDEVREFVKTNFPDKQFTRFLDDILTQANNDFGLAVHNIQYLLGKSHNNGEARHSITKDGAVEVKPLPSNQEERTTPKTEDEKVMMAMKLIKALFPEELTKQMVKENWFNTDKCIDPRLVYVMIENSIRYYFQRSHYAYLEFLTALYMLAKKAKTTGDNSFTKKLFLWDQGEVLPIMGSPKINGQIPKILTFPKGKFSVSREKVFTYNQLLSQVDSLFNGRDVMTDSRIYKKNIILDESTAKILKEEMSFTPFKFMGHIRKFLSQLLSDSTTAMPSNALVANGLNKTKLLRLLDSNGIIQKNMRLSDRDENNNPKTVTMKIRYQVPKDGFDDKIEKLYYDTIGGGLLGETTGCCGGGGGFGCSNSGEYINPLTGVVRRKKKKKKIE